MIYTRIDSRAIAPKRAHHDDAGFDLFALEDLRINPGEIVRIRTGIKLHLRSNRMGIFKEKSGRAWSEAIGRPVGLHILAGLIDTGYHGELSIIAQNLNIWNTLQYIRMNPSARSEEGRIALEDALKDVVVIPYGKAVCQMILSEPWFDETQEIGVEEFDKLVAEKGALNTERGGQGFGSTDRGSIIHRPDDGYLQQYGNSAHSVNRTKYTLPPGRPRSDTVDEIDIRERDC